MPTYRIVSPSWMRPDGCSTHLCLKSVEYVVSKSQAGQYRARGLRVWECPDKAQGNLCRVRNWILDNAKVDGVAMIDDDFGYFGRWIGHVRKRLGPKETEDMLRMGFDLAEQFNVRFWGVNPMNDKMSYRENTPFGLSQYIGGPLQCHLRNDLRYDESIPLKDDYDMTLQVLNKYRKALRLNMFHYFVKQHENRGGCAAYRTIKKEQEQFELLQKKWGSAIVRRDFLDASRKRKKKITTYDINPILKVPIGGV